MEGVRLEPVVSEAGLNVRIVPHNDKYKNKGAFQIVARGYLDKHNTWIAKSFIMQGHYDHKGGTPDSCREITT